MWHFALSHFSPETVSVYRPLLLFIPFFSYIPSSVFFFCQSFFRPSSLTFIPSVLPSLTSLSPPPIFLFPPTHSCLLTSPFLARKQAVALPNDFHQSWLWDNGSGTSHHCTSFMKYAILIVCGTFCLELPIIQINCAQCLHLKQPFTCNDQFKRTSQCITNVFPLEFWNSKTIYFKILDTFT